MREEITLTGIVLYTSLVNEYDKRLVVLTKERGKVTIFANGARRPNSMIRAASQAFVMGKFTVVAGREAYTLVGADIEEYFNEISKDMEKYCYAAYFGEFMSYYTREGGKCKSNLNLLYCTFKALVAGIMPLELIRYVYELRLMHIEGQGLHAFNCVKCNSEKELVAFSAKEGGFLCKECANKKDFLNGAVTEVSKSVIYTIQFIENTPVNRLYGFAVDESIFAELKHLADEFRTEYVDKRFNSLEILSSLA